MNVVFTAVYAPQWANGSTCTNCNPINNCSCTQTSCNGCDTGRTVTSSQYTYNFFYNMAKEFNGSCVSGCSTNATTCHPLVQYFGVWNEPDGLNNYWDKWFDSDLGNYLNDFNTQYLFPWLQCHRAGRQGKYRQPRRRETALRWPAGASPSGPKAVRHQPGAAGEGSGGLGGNRAILSARQESAERSA